MKTFSEIADAVMNDPRIESGLVQQTRARDFMATTKDKSGIPEKRLTQRTVYRVFVCLSKMKDPEKPLMGKVHYEASSVILMDAVREVFAKLEMTLPGGL